MRSLAGAIALVCVAGCSGGSRAVTADANGEVTTQTSLGELLIADGAHMTAPAGHSLSMTVNGVETPIAPGRYQGAIVLTPSEDIDVPFNAMGQSGTAKFRAAIVVQDGKLSLGQSVLSAVSGGAVTDSGAHDFKLQSRNERFNGLMLGGKTDYTLSHTTFELTGAGRNDFNGVGAAIRSGGDTHLASDGLVVRNQGAVRTAVWVGDRSVAEFNNADIEVKDGPLPKDYGWSWLKGPAGSHGDVMMEVPWMLGLRGNNRATLVVGHGSATYVHSRIRAQRWGAMSTDAADEVRLNLIDCTVQAIENGYGTYADGNSLVTAKNTRFDVADYGAILSGGSVELRDGTRIESRRIGVMAHGTQRGRLLIDHSSIRAEKAVIQLKTSSPTIVIDSSELVSKQGVLLQIMPQDDPNYRPGGMMAPGGAGGPPPGAAAGPGGPGAPAAAAPRAQQFSTSDGDTVADVTISNSTLNGDFYNSDSSTTGMSLQFAGSTLVGAISTATPKHAVGPNGETIRIQESGELYYLIGEQTQTPTSVAAPNGAKVSLDAKSRWNVTGTSYLNSLQLAPGATLDAPAGMNLRLLVNGVARPIAPGTYTGRIELVVSSAAARAD